MSSASKGAQRVGSALSQFARLGFRCSRVSASGQRKGARRNEKCIAGDLIALAPEGSGWPHVIAEIGGVGKRLGAAFHELTSEPLAAGFAPIVGRVVARRWRWYSDADTRHNTLREALDALGGRDITLRVHLGRARRPATIVQEANSRQNDTVRSRLDSLKGQ